MSIHSSLRGIDTLAGERSVLTRLERIQKLRKDSKFDVENQSVFGLPKVRTKFKIAGAKKVKAAEGDKAAAAAPVKEEPAKAESGKKDSGKKEGGKKEPKKK